MDVTGERIGMAETGKAPALHALDQIQGAEAIRDLPPRCGL